jgi:hypothetical protein
VTCHTNYYNLSEFWISKIFFWILHQIFSQCSLFLFWKIKSDPSAFTCIFCNDNLIKIWCLLYLLFLFFYFFFWWCTNIKRHSMWGHVSWPLFHCWLHQWCNGKHVCSKCGRLLVKEALVDWNLGLWYWYVLLLC